MLTQEDLLATWESGIAAGQLRRALMLHALTGSDSLDAPIGRRDRELFALRRLLFGDRLPVQVDCTACGEQMEFDFDIGNVLATVEPAGEQWVEAGDWRVLVRPPTSADLQAVAEVPPPRAKAALLDRCVQAVERAPGAEEASRLDPGAEGARRLDPGAEGARRLDPGAEGARRLDPGAEGARRLDPGAEGARRLDPGAERARRLDPGVERVSRLDPGAERADRPELGALPAEVRDRIIAAVAEADPAADVRLLVPCVECGHRTRAAVDVAACLWAELDGWARGLLADVHVLASAYGWTEPDVLALSPTRRRYYLELVDHG
jgi:hypothetical protein